MEIIQKRWVVILVIAYASLSHEFVSVGIIIVDTLQIVNICPLSQKRIFEWC